MGLHLLINRPFIMSALLVVGIIIPSLSVLGALVGSKHDLRIPGSAESPCIYCHLPYKDAEEPPLWDKEAKVLSWKLKFPKKEKAPSAKVCLSCHDGNIAQDIIAFIPSEEVRRQSYIVNKGFHIVDGFELLFREEGSDHPIGVRLEKLAEVNPDLRIRPIGNLRLKKGRMDCTTCHSAHAETPYKGFLVMDNAGSSLCLGCHIK